MWFLMWFFIGIVIGFLLGAFFFPWLTLWQLTNMTMENGHQNNGCVHENCDVPSVYKRLAEGNDAFFPLMIWSSKYPHNQLAGLREKLEEIPSVLLGKSMVSCRFSRKSTHRHKNELWGSRIKGLVLTFQQKPSIFLMLIMGVS